MSSKGAPPPENEGDGSTSKASNNSPEPSPSNSDSTTPPPPPPAESESETPPAPPQPAAVIPPPDDATPVTPGVPVAGANPVNVPVQPGAITAPPPPHKAAKKSPSKHSSEGNESDTGLLIGVLAGAGLLILLVIAIVCCACCNKRKKKKNPYVGQDQMHFYGTGGPNGGQYYNTQPQKKWQSPDHAIHVSQGGQYYNSTPPHKKWQSPKHALQIPPPVGVPIWGGQFSPHQGNHSADMSSSLSSPQSHPVPPPPPPMSLGFNKNAFTYDELAAATSGFAPSNLLGQGGFGYVHKGVLPNGQEIAVKSLKTGSGQGEREFQAEVEIISRVHHRHLVSLVGYCIAGGQRMLVYEFVPNNNLEFHLHGKGRPPIEWGMRLKIALGSAKGLSYLHEDCHPRIIHRDIKTANILLDYSFDAKVADFGLAKLTSDNNTHVSTRIMGTFGYLAPEYASSGKLTEKSDVYSFGVMLLELITGRRPLDVTGQMEESLVDWARPLLQRAIEEGNYDEIIDPRLKKNYVPHEVKRMVACAAASIRHSSRRRPKMSQIVRALEGDVSLDDLNDGVKPGQSTMFNSSEDSEYGNTTYTAEIRKFRKMAFESQEYQSSEYGATSEYGLNPSSSSDSGETKMSSKPPSRIL